MATVVNNPGTTESSNSTALIVAAIVLLAAVFFFFYFGRGLLSGTNSGGSTAPAVEVPREIDVNVNPGGQGGQ